MNQEGNERSKMSPVLATLFLTPTMRNSVLEEFREKTLADIQKKLHFGGWRYLSQICEDGTRKKLSIICVKVVV